MTTAYCRPTDKCFDWDDANAALHIDPLAADPLWGRNACNRIKRPCAGRTSDALGMPPTIGGSWRNRPKVRIEAVDQRRANFGDQAKDLVAGRVH